MARASDVRVNITADTSALRAKFDEMLLALNAAVAEARRPWPVRLWRRSVAGCRAFGRGLWLAFRVWNAVLLGVLGASLAIVGCVLLGASWGAWPFSWAWLADGLRSYSAKAGSDGAGGVEGNATREGLTATAATLASATASAATTPNPSAGPIPRSEAPRRAAAPEASVEPGTAPSLPTSPTAGAPEPVLDGSSSAGARGNEGSPQPDGASTSPAAATVKAHNLSTGNYADMRLNWRND